MRIRCVAVPRQDIYDGGDLKHSATFRFETILPDISFTLKPLNPIPLMKTPLAIQLTSFNDQVHPSGASLISSQRSGFLTMSSVRQIIPILETDSELASIPLVGVWVHAQKNSLSISQSDRNARSQIKDTLIWAACVRYFQSDFLKERVWIQNNTFLLVILHYL